MMPKGLMSFSLQITSVGHKLHFEAQAEVGQGLMLATPKMMEMPIEDCLVQVASVALTLAPVQMTMRELTAGVMSVASTEAVGPRSQIP